MVARPVPGVFPSFPPPAHFKKGNVMSENLFSPGQRIMTKEGKDNFDRIFKKKKKKCKDCGKDKKDEEERRCL